MKINSVHQSLLFSILIFIGIFLCSFQCKFFHPSIVTRQLTLLDSSKSVHTRLGKTRYYIEKPESFIIKAMMEQDQESTYSTFSEDQNVGRCTITIDKKYHERKSKVKVATYFNDDVLGHNISIQEYSDGKSFIRKGELENNGEFIYFECFGKSKEMLEKFYLVAKSLSYKSK
jgi:hypothetical protein